MGAPRREATGAGCAPGLKTRFHVLFQIAPSAKKLWGVDEGGSKDEGGVKGGGILHLGDHQMWRDSTWSTSGRILPFRFSLPRYRVTRNPCILSCIQDRRAVHFEMTKTSRLVRPAASSVY